MNCPYCAFAGRIGKIVLSVALLLAVPVLAILVFGLSAPASTDAGLKVLEDAGYRNMHTAIERNQTGTGADMSVYLDKWQYTAGSSNRR